MAKKLKKKMVRDLTPSDFIYLPSILEADMVKVVGIQDLNYRIPTEAGNLYILKVDSKAGPFRNKDGECILSGDFQVEVIPPKKKSFSERVAAYFLL